MYQLFLVIRIFTYNILTSVLVNSWILPFLSDAIYMLFLTNLMASTCNSVLNGSAERSFHSYFASTEDGFILLGLSGELGTLTQNTGKTKNQDNIN